MQSINRKKYPHKILRNVLETNRCTLGFGAYLRGTFSSDKNGLTANYRNRNKSRFFHITAIFLQCDSAFVQVVPPTFLCDLCKFFAYESSAA